jgi:SAM-dependent methyltransferase
VSGEDPPPLWRLPLRVLLVLGTALLAFCARSPAEGPGWRTAFVLSALALSLLVVLAWQRGGYTRGAVLGLALLLRALVFPLTPVLSDDGFRYVWDGMVQAEGINPYRIVPSDPALAPFHGEPIHGALNSAHYYSVYPPLSQLVFAVGGAVYPLGWRASWYAVKLLVALAEVGGLLLLSRMVRARALVLYAWSPLVVVEAAGQGHTDALAVPLLLLGVLAIRRRRGALAGAALAAAGWVKLLPFVLVPLALKRGGWRVLVGAAALSALVVVPYAAPYVVPHVRVSLGLYVQLFEFNAGPYYVLKGLLALATGADWSKALGPALVVPFLASLAAVYAAHARGRLGLVSAFALGLGLFFACATTVHPWYLLPVLALVPLLIERPAGRLFAWGWVWLAAWSLATYWRYAGPAWGYPAAVAFGWSGWAAFMVASAGVRVLPALLRRRAESKWRWIEQHLPPSPPRPTVLDLGAGEGFVGEAARRRLAAEVTLADVVDFNRSSLPLHLHDGRTLPFADGRFDLTLLVFVLHHAEDPERVLAEARRVTRGAVVVVESVYEGPVQRELMERLDRLANALRSGGRMAEQPPRFRTDAEWRSAFARLGLRVVAESRRGRWVHVQRLYTVGPLLQ